MQMTGVAMVHVPYRGSPQSLTGLLAGEVQAMFDTLSTSIEHIKAGRLRALGVTSAKRAEALPDTPALSEAVPGYEATSWQGFGAPKDTPARDRRKAQPRDQRRACRRHREGPHRGDRLFDLCDRFAGRIPGAHRGRDRQVGQGDPHRGHPAELRG